MDYSKMSYNQLKINFERGILDPYDLMDEYKKTRFNVMKQVNIIDKSDVPFTVSERPDFVKPSEIESTEDLLKAFSELNEFKNSGYYSLKERHEKRDKAIGTMREHGIGSELIISIKCTVAKTTL